MSEEGTVFPLHVEKEPQQPIFNVSLTPEGVWEFEGIGYFRPEEDITVWESTTICSMLTAISVQAITMQYIPALPDIFAAVNNDVRLKRHFKEN